MTRDNSAQPSDYPSEKGSFDPIRMLQHDAKLSIVDIEYLTAIKSHLSIWNKRVNLVSAASLEEYWTRHIYDCWQLNAHISPHAETVWDLGSGAGFPGLVIAVLHRDNPALRISLIESRRKKVEFLHHVAETLALPVQVLHARIEELPSQEVDVLMARALAPLPQILAYAEKFWAQKTLGLFLKGARHGTEIEAARKHWQFAVQAVPSVSEPGSALLKIRDLQKAQGLPMDKRNIDGSKS